MNYLVFDIETDALLDEVTTIACICTLDQDGVEKVYHDTDGLERDGSIDDGVERLFKAGKLVAHNGQGFDIPVIEKIFALGGAYRWPPLYDTAIASRLHYPDLRAADSRSGKVSKELRGSHKLAAWGERLGLHKGTEDVSEGVKVLTQEIIDYCLQDCRVTDKLYQRLLQDKWPEESTKLEHEFAGDLEPMRHRGVGFHTEKAEAITAELMSERASLDEQVSKTFPPWKIQMKTKVKYEPFNPGSRDQVARYFKEKYDWNPDVFTPAGKPKLDEKILNGLEFPEAKLLARRFLVSKLLGQIAEGEEAWLGHVKDGRIYGAILHNGAVTGRCAHFGPNLAQVPKVGKPWGRECRECFIPSEGMVFVGADASGLELRMEAHYMNDEEFIRILLDGDIHDHNRRSLGIPDGERDRAKTWIYAFNYGAGDEKLGSILGVSTAEAKKIKKRFLDNTPALKRLQSAVKEASKRGFLIGLDGRRVPVRQTYRALNTLLQSAGAIVMKKATVIASPTIRELGGHLVLHVHDELQIECPPESAKAIGEAVVESFRLAGEYFNLKVPLTGEYKIGSSWAETH